MPAASSTSPRARPLRTARQERGRALLLAHLAAVGMTDRAYAHAILLRDKATLFRWKTAAAPIPAPVLDLLEHWDAMRELARRDP